MKNLTTFILTAFMLLGIGEVWCFCNYTNEIYSNSKPRKPIVYKSSKTGDPGDPGQFRISESGILSFTVDISTSKNGDEIIDILGSNLVLKSEMRIENQGNFINAPTQYYTILASDYYSSDNVCHCGENLFNDYVASVIISIDLRSIPEITGMTCDDLAYLKYKSEIYIGINSNSFNSISLSDYDDCNDDYTSIWPQSCYLNHLNNTQAFIKPYCEINGGNNNVKSDHSSNSKNKKKITYYSIEGKEIHDIASYKGLTIIHINDGSHIEVYKRYIGN